jgi:hypothetical protein
LPIPRIQIFLFFSFFFFFETNERELSLQKKEQTTPSRVQTLEELKLCFELGFPGYFNALQRSPDNWVPPCIHAF